MCNIVSCYVLLCIVSHTRGVWSIHNSHDNSRVVRGYDAKIEQYPHNAFLELNDGNEIRYCGGSIVSKKCIVTTASCLYGIKRVTARIGSSYSSSENSLYTGGMEYTTTSFSIHPEYNNNTGEFDVGVVKIDGGMKLNGRNTDIIRLPFYGNDAGDEILVITGWGAPANYANGRYELLQRGKALAIPRYQCKQREPYIGRRMICTKSEATICKVDYGGPAMGEDYTLRAVSAYNRNCSDPNNYAVYTRLGDPLIRNYLTMETGV